MAAKPTTPKDWVSVDARGKEVSRSSGSNPPAEAASEGADTEDVDAGAGESAASGTVAADVAGAGTEGAASKDADADAEPDVAEGRTEPKTGDSALGLRKVVAPDTAGGRDSDATAGATETEGSTDSEMGSPEFSRLESSSSEEAAERGRQRALPRPRRPRQRRAPLRQPRGRPPPTPTRPAGHEMRLTQVEGTHPNPFSRRKLNACKKDHG